MYKVPHTDNIFPRPLNARGRCRESTRVLSTGQRFEHCYAALNQLNFELPLVSSDVA